MLLLALLTFALPQTLSAAEFQSIITLIPTEILASKGQPETAEISGDNFGGGKVLLRFQASSLPAQAKLTAARLSLVSTGVKGAQLSIAVDKYPYDAKLPPQQNSLVSFGTITTSGGNGIRAYWNAAPDFLNSVTTDGGKFSLLLSTTSAGKTTWSTNSSTIGNRPRLILEYTLADRPAVTQSNGAPAVQSARAFLPTGAQSGQFSYVTKSFSNAWSYTPVFYSDLVYLIVDDNNKKVLRALDPLGGTVVRTTEIKDAPGQHMLVSGSGRLYIVGNGKIITYQLGSDTTPQALPLENLNPAIPPTLSSDGSLYFVNGQEVYGFNPDLQGLWKVTLEDKASSRVTIGPTGKFVYLAGSKEGLLSINAQTGETTKSPLPNQKALSEADNPSLQAPVVILHPDGTEKIYVAANSVNDGILASFNNRSGTITAAEKWPPLNGLWGQPMLDQQSPGGTEAASGKKVFAVKVANGNGTLTAIDWLSGATTDMTPAFGVGSSPYLLAGGNLASDLSDNRFVWNGAGDTGLYVFGASFSGPLQLPASGIPMKAQLMFGGDGTLYANTVEGDRVLRAIVPQYTLSEGNSANIVSPTHLRVDGTVGNSAVLKAGGNVLVGPGFTVRQGATLSIATGNPKQ
jgi:hypothetical protein